MIVRLSDRGVNEGQLVNDGRHVREQIGHPCTRLAVLLEVERALHQRAGITLADANLPFAFQSHPVILPQVGLVIECVHLADSATHEQVDDLLRPRLEMRRLGQVGRVLHTFRP